jgi:hypothetical protein
VSHDEIANWSTERWLSRWVVCAIIAVPLIAILLRELAVAPFAARLILYGIIMVPTIAMVSHRDFIAKPIVRWIIYAIVAIPLVVELLF